MVHKKYTFKNGKLYGPYLYENKRVGEKVVTTYVGKDSPRKLFSLLIIVATAILVLLAGAYFLHQSSPTGKAIVDVSGTYSLGEQLDGTMKLSLKSGELLPLDSLVVLHNGDQTVSIPLKDLVNSPSTSGTFYAEGSDISGNGEGFGEMGSATIYPTIDFQLLITNSHDSSSDSSSNTDDNSTNEQAPAQTPAEDGSTSAEEQPSQETPSEPTGEEETTDNSDSSSSSPDSSESPSDSGSPITGSVISEEEYTVSGHVSKDHDFTYNLEDGQQASIVDGSVEYNGAALDDGAVNLDVSNSAATVKTDYSVNEDGFGEEFIGDAALELTIDLSKFNISVASPDLKIDLEYEGSNILSVNENLNIEGSTPVEPQNETEEPTEGGIISNQTNVTNAVNVTNESSNQSTLFIISQIPTLRLSKDSSASLDLADYFSGAESYELTGDNLSISLSGSEASIGADEGFFGATRATATAYLGEENLSIQFLVLVSSGAVNVQTLRNKIVVGEPVVWVKNVTLEQAENVSIALPAEATNISITKVVETQEAPAIASVSGITGNVVNGKVVAEVDTDKESGFVAWIRKLFSRITGNVVSDETSDEPIVVTLADNATQYLVEYTTPAPEITETPLSNGKSVTISGPELNYTDVIASTNVEFPVKTSDSSSLKLYWYNYDTTPQTPDAVKTVAEVAETSVVDESSINLNSSDELPEPAATYVLQEMPFDSYDTDFDGNIDYIEWVVPHLSNQRFDLVITNGNNTGSTNVSYYGDYAALTINRNIAPYGNLVAYWPFDTVLSATAYPDLSGNNFNAVIDGDDALLPATYGNAYYANGSSATYANYNSAFAPSSFSASFWLYPTNVTSDGGGYGAIRGPGSNGYLEGWRCNKGGFTDFTLYCGVTNTTGSTATLQASGTLNAYQWDYIALSYNSTTGNYTMYNNGLAVGTDTIPGGVKYTNGNGIVIGSCDGCNPWKGLIDEVMFFNSSLNSTQVRDIYNNQSARFVPSGTINTKPLNVSQETGFNVTTDGYIRYDKSNISTRLGLWDTTRGYNNTGPDVAAYYHLDSLVFGSSTTDSALGNSGTMVGTYSLIGGAPYSNGMNFDGSSGGINIPDSTALNTQTITVSTWVRLRATQTSRIFMAKYANSPTSGWGLGISDSSNNVVKWYTSTSAGSSDTLYSNTVLANNQWYNVVSTFDGTTKKLYINGVLDNSNTWSNTIGYGSTFTGIGYLRAANTQYLNGDLDEVVVFNRTLSDQEVKNLYSSGRANWNYAPYTGLNDLNSTYNYKASSGIQFCILDNTTDVCGTNGNGALADNAVFVKQPSIVRNASLYLDGTNDYLNMTSTTTNLSGSSFTASIWARRNSTGTFQGMLWQGVEAADQSLLLAFRGGDSVTCAFYSDDLDSPVTYQDKDWHMWTCTYNTATNNRTLYRDGVPITTDSPTGGAGAMKGSGPIRIGRYGAGSPLAFNGTLDDVALWNRALSPAEVNNIYYSSKDSHSLNQFPTESKTTTVQIGFNLTSGPYSFTTPYLSGTSAAPLSAIPTEDALAPILFFIPPTPANNSVVTGTTLALNLTSQDASTHHTFVDIDGDLALWLRMDVNGSGQPIDSSPYNSTVVQKLGPQYEPTGGKFGSSFRFFGNNSYLRVYDNMGLRNQIVGFGHNITRQTGITVATWVKYNGTQNNYGKILSRPYYSNDWWFSPYVSYALGGANGVGNNIPEFELSTLDGTLHTTSTTTTLTNGTWYQVVGTYNGTQMAIYVNGVRESMISFTGDIGSNWPPDSGLVIGQHHYNTDGESFNGSIDEVMIFGRGLSDAEVGALYNSSATQFSTNLTIGYGKHTATAYSFDDFGNLNYGGTTAVSYTNTLMPSINWTTPTPANGTQVNSTTELNISIADDEIDSLVFNNNGVNYTVYDNSTTLLLNFDNSSALGENTNTIVDVSPMNNYIDFHDEFSNSYNSFSMFLPGKYGGLGYYINRSANGLYVRNDQYQILPNNGSFSIAFWMRPSAVHDGGLITQDLSNHGDYLVRGYRFALVDTNHLFLWSNQNNGTLGLYSNLQIQNNTWYHVVVSYNPNPLIGSAMYVDGQVTATSTGYIVPSPSDIGIAPTTAGFGTFEGTLDNVMILNRSLTAAEARKLYDSNLVKVNKTQWMLYENVSGISTPSATYQTYVTDSAGYTNSTDMRVYNYNMGFPSISFASTTPTNESNINSPLILNLTSNDSGTHYSFVDLDRSNILWATFDTNNETGQPVDNSSYGHSLMASGAAQSSISSFGRSMYFDGTNDFINASDYPEYTFTNGQATFSTWVYFTSMPSADKIFVAKRLGLTAEYQFGLKNTNVFKISLPTSGTSCCTDYTLDSVAPTNNTWYHIAVTFNDSANLISWYLNGVNVENDSTALSLGTDTNIPLTIGSEEGVTEFMNGYLDDLMMFNRTLSLPEIKSLYNASATPYYYNVSSTYQGRHTYQGFAMNANGNLNRTDLRSIIYDTLRPNVNFTFPTPSGGSSGGANSIYVNVSTNDTNTVYSFVDFKKDVMAWYTMDNVTPSRVLDQSTYSGNLTINGDSLQNTSGRFGKAYKLDGNGDYLAATDNKIGNITTTNITVSAWIKMFGNSVDQKIVSKRPGWALAVYSDNQIEFEIFNSTYGSGLEATTFRNTAGTSLSSNTWYHIVGTYNGTTAVTYVNGVRDAMDDFKANEINATNTPLTIGKEADSSGGWFNGLVDEVLVFNRTLTQTEISALYNATATPYQNNFTGLANSAFNIRANVVDIAGNRNESLQTISTSAGTLDSCLEVSSSGLYNLTRNLNDADYGSSNACLNITANNVTLDCFGYSITVNTASRNAIAVTAKNVSIKNCMANASTTALLFSVTASNVTVYNNSFKGSTALVIPAGFSNSTFIGNYFITSSSSGAAAQVSSRNNLFMNNNATSTITSSTERGFYITGTAANNVFINNTARKLNYGFYIDSTGINNTFINNTARDITGSSSESGFYITASNGNVLIGNTIFNGTERGITLFGNSNNNVLIGNVVFNITPNAFHIMSSRNNTFINNVAYGSSSGFSVWATNDSVFINNTAFNNVAFGFIVNWTRNNTFINNTALNNGKYGFSLSNRVSNSTISNNNITNNTVGIYLNGSNSNTFTGNMINLSRDTGIYFNRSSFNNTINSNLIMNSSNNGIWLNFTRDVNVSNNIIIYNFNGITTSNVNSSVLDNNTLVGNRNHGMNLGNFTNSTVTNINSSFNVLSGIAMDGRRTSNLTFANIEVDNNGNQGLETSVVSPNITVINLSSSFNAQAGMFLWDTFEFNLFNSIFNGNLYGINLPITSAYGEFSNITINGSNQYGLIFGSGGGVIGNNFTNITITNTNASTYDLMVASDSYDNNAFYDYNINNYSFAGNAGSLFVFGNTTAQAEIRFTGRIYGNGTSLTRDIRIANNLAYVNSTITTLNGSANITFTNIISYGRPAILRDNLPCSTSVCMNITALTGSVVKFNVTGWSNYTIGGSASTNCTSGCFYIRSTTGLNRTIIDKQGNLDLTGTVTQNSVGSPDGSDFIIKNSAGDPVAWVDGSTGNIRLAGTLSYNQGTECSPAGNNFVIRNTSGSCVAYIDSSGNMWLQGGYNELALI